MLLVPAKSTSVFGDGDVQFHGVTLGSLLIALDENIERIALI
jgi:hypothetical protein